MSPLATDGIRPRAWRIVADPVLRDTLDLSRPVALMLVAVLHHVSWYGTVTQLGQS